MEGDDTDAEVGDESVREECIVEVDESMVACCGEAGRGVGAFCEPSVTVEDTEGDAV